MSKLVVCKTCGNDDLTEVSEGILKCKYCRHLTERPKENADLMERAHNLRFNSKDFDEAAKIYEEVIRLTPNEAEAYWGRVLCRFGIEYVKDTNGEYLPTCHRTIQSSILDDADYLMAVNKASGDMKAYYTEQAKLIDTYQTKIKVIAAKEQPYDVFISFKATDNGKPTEDSLIAQEIYYYLTKNLGLKVFFSNITLKDKAGQEYEPIIFAALSSATVMVLVGTKNEYINATWVKNEWSRYIGMVADAKKQNKSKYIVTAINGMRPEELPSALASYQAVNIGELGAKEKLCSNIDSLIGDLRVAKSSKSSGGSIDANDMLAAEATNLSKLGLQQVELGNIDKANEYFDKALEKKADTALANWGKLLIDQNVKNDDELSKKTIKLSEYSYCRLALENANEDERIRFQKVVDACEDLCKRADAKTQHNNDYLAEIEKLKYDLSQATGKNAVPSSDKTLNDIIAKKEKCLKQFNEADNEHRKLTKQVRWLTPWIITCIVAAIFVLVMLVIIKSVNILTYIGFAALAFGALMLILGIIKNGQLKSAIETTRKTKSNCLELVTKAKRELYGYTGKLMETLNSEFQNLYGDEIDEYKPNYYLAIEVLKIQNNDLKEVFGIDKRSAKIDIPAAEPGMAHIYVDGSSRKYKVVEIISKNINVPSYTVSAAMEVLPAYAALNVPKDKAEKTIHELKAIGCMCELRYK